MIDVHVFNLVLKCKCIFQLDNTGREKREKHGGGSHFMCSCDDRKSYSLDFNHVIFSS